MDKTYVICEHFYIKKNSASTIIALPDQQTACYKNTEGWKA